MHAWANGVLDKLQTMSCNKGEQWEDLYEKSAKVCQKHQASNRLEKKASKHKILLHSNKEDQRAQ
jgi:hypothetical protein